MDRAKTGETMKSTQTRTKLVLAVLVLLVLLAIGGLIFASVNLSNTNSLEDDQEAKIRDIDRQINDLEADVLSFRNKLSALEKEVKNETSLDCTLCSSYFVSEAYVNASLANVTSQINAVNASLNQEIDKVEATIAELVLNGSLGNCSDFVTNTTFQAFVVDIEAQIAAVEAVNVLSSNNFARATGVFGPYNATTGGPSEVWSMESLLTCYGGKFDNDRQIQSQSLVFSTVTDEGLCPGTSQPLLATSELNGVTQFCPCEDGYYMVSIDVQNLFVVRTTPDTGFTLYDRGGVISFGLAYLPPYYDGKPVFFNNGSWPLPPVLAVPWESVGTDPLVYKPELEQDYDQLRDLSGSFFPISGSASQALYLRKSVPEWPLNQACYNLIMTAFDPFLEPDSTPTFCGSPFLTAQVQYTFFAPNRNPGVAGQFNATLTVQRLAWTDEAPDPPYY